jgi:hypothetical protein
MLFSMMTGSYIFSYHGLAIRTSDAFLGSRKTCDAAAGLLQIGICLGIAEANVA